MSDATPSFELPRVLGALIDARAAHPDTAKQPFLRFADSPEIWTYARYRDESVRLAHFLLRRLGAIDDHRPGHVAMLLHNRPELLSLYGACGYAGLTLFGINTGLRGDTLAGVINQSQARVLVVDAELEPRVREVAGQLQHLDPENLLVVGASERPEVDLAGRVTSEVAPGTASLDTPDRRVTPETNLMVIYTSGTTGLPKGINNSHLKFLLIGQVVSQRMEIGADAVGYACMPLFHSNALFLGFHPALEVGGSLAVRSRFSASRFVGDVIQHGVTFWNYVGEPVHYVLSAVEQAYAGDEERILAEVAGHPDNHLRFAIGNGASPPDIDRFTRWLGLEDMFELYGSTEAAISTFRRKGDPRGCVGEITDESVKILREDGGECPPADVDADGRISNYEAAVGEICRVAPDSGLFQGYFDNEGANDAKYREGVYHSGDLGHVQTVGDKRYLFFDGRTDDWIRKDGENFSAAPIARLVQESPDVDLAAAYGAPCPVSDEWVMVALRLRPGARFDGQAFFDFCDGLVRERGMDRKWFPDFVRIVDDFEFTQTQKILVRSLKKDHFHRDRLPDAPIYWRQRGSDRFVPFAADDFAALRGRFEASERAPLLDR